MAYNYLVDAAMDSAYVSFGWIDIIRTYWYSTYQLCVGDIGDHPKGCRIDVDNTRKKSLIYYPLWQGRNKRSRIRNSTPIVTNTFFGRKTATYNTDFCLVWQKQHLFEQKQDTYYDKRS